MGYEYRAVRTNPHSGYRTRRHAEVSRLMRAAGFLWLLLGR